MKKRKFSGILNHGLLNNRSIMNKRFIFPILMTLVLMVSACSVLPDKQAPETGYTVTDALGREVTFKKVPRRIVLLGRGVFMVADAIYIFPEASEKIIAIAGMDQKSEAFLKMIDADYQEKASLDQSASAEQIAALQPDCVVMKATNKKLGDSLEASQIPIVYLALESPSQYQWDLFTLGELLQNPERAKEVANFFSDSSHALHSPIDELEPDQRPTTLLLHYSEKEGAVTYNVPPAKWIQTTIVEMAGGQPVWKNSPLEDGWTVVSMEQVAAWNPEYIFVTAYSGSIPEIAEKLKQDSQWQALDAVKNGKIYPFASDVYSWDIPDTRWIMGAEWMAKVLHPELFPGYNPVANAASFYQKLYGMDQPAFNKHILPILSVTLPAQ